VGSIFGAQKINDLQNRTVFLEYNMYQKAINCKQRKGLDACKGKQAKGGEVYFVREGDALLLCIG